MSSESGKDGATVQETGVGGLQMEISTRGVGFLADEPVENGGLGSGPTPYDLLCAALGACTAMTLRLYAQRKGWPLGNVRVLVRHVRPIATSEDRFMRELELSGELTDEQRARLMDVARRCPVHLTLEHGSHIETIEVPVRPPRTAT